MKKSFLYIALTSIIALSSCTLDPLKYLSNHENTSLSQIKGNKVAVAVEFDKGTESVILTSSKGETKTLYASETVDFSNDEDITLSIKTKRYGEKDYGIESKQDIKKGTFSIKAIVQYGTVYFNVNVSKLQKELQAKYDKAEKDALLNIKPSSAVLAAGASGTNDVTLTASASNLYGSAPISFGSLPKDSDGFRKISLQDERIIILEGTLQTGDVERFSFSKKGNVNNNRYYRVFLDSANADLFTSYNKDAIKQTVFAGANQYKQYIDSLSSDCSKCVAITSTKETSYFGAVVSNANSNYKLRIEDVTARVKLSFPNGKPSDSIIDKFVSVIYENDLLDKIDFNLYRTIDGKGWKMKSLSDDFILILSDNNQNEAFKIGGAIYQKYKSNSGTFNFGYPTTKEKSDYINGVRYFYQEFNTAQSIYFIEDRGTIAFKSGIYSSWIKNKGKLGLPKNDEQRTDYGVYQLFDGGEIQFDQTGAIIVDNNNNALFSNGVPVLKNIWAYYKNFTGRNNIGSPDISANVEISSSSDSTGISQYFSNGLIFSSDKSKTVFVSNSFISAVQKYMNISGNSLGFPISEVFTIQNQLFGYTVYDELCFEEGVIRIPLFKKDGSKNDGYIFFIYLNDDLNNPIYGVTEEKNKFYFEGSPYKSNISNPSTSGGSIMSTLPLNNEYISVDVSSDFISTPNYNLSPEDIIWNISSGALYFLYNSSGVDNFVTYFNPDSSALEKNKAGFAISFSFMPFVQAGVEGFLDTIDDSKYQEYSNYKTAFTVKSSESSLLKIFRGKISKATLTAFERGRMVEKRVLEDIKKSFSDIKKELHSATINGIIVRTIPDAVSTIAKKVIEIKDVQILSKSRQLLAQMDLAKNKKFQYILLVTPNNRKISKPLANEILSGGNIFKVNDNNRITHELRKTIGGNFEWFGVDKNLENIMR